MNAPPFETEWRPEFDVTLAFNPRSVLVPVARIEGLTWTVLAPGSVPGGNFLAGQGAAVTLDGRYDAVLERSRSLFINLGGDMNALSAGSRAAQWMLLEQAIREARNRAPIEDHGPAASARPRSAGEISRRRSRGVPRRARRATSAAQLRLRNVMA